MWINSFECILHIQLEDNGYLHYGTPHIAIPLNRIVDIIYIDSITFDIIFGDKCIQRIEIHQDNIFDLRQYLDYINSLRLKTMELYAGKGLTNDMKLQNFLQM